MSVAVTPLPTADTATQIRDAAVTSLLGYVTLAAQNVEAERIDNVPTGTMPRIVVFADEDGSIASRGGTAPAFDVTATLVIQCLVERAQKADAVADADALIAQVKDCLLSDPCWVSLAGRIDSVRTQRSFKADGQRIVGDARVEIRCAWREIYPPRIPTRLDGINLTVGSPSVLVSPTPPTPVPVDITVDLS